MGRYAEAKYGEYATALGEFTTGRTITISVYNAATGASLTLTSNSCTEIGTTGVYRWSTSDLQSQPVGYTEMLYIMLDSTTGRTHKGKIIVGGFPSDSAVARFQGAVWIDVTNGSAGTAFPKGTPQDPVDNVTDARTIANAENLKEYRAKGAITITVDHEDWKFTGVTPNSDIVTVQAPASIARSTFESIGIRGDLNGSIAAEQCIIGTAISTVTGLNGTFTECGFDGIIRPAPAPGRVQGLRLSSLGTNILSPTTVIDFNNALCLWLSELKGIWSLRNMSASLPAAAFAVSLSGCELTLESTVAGGNIILLPQGGGELTDNKVGAADFSDNILRGSDTKTLTATSYIDTSTDPWLEIWTRAGVTLATFALYDETLSAINAGNPISGKYVRRRLAL